MHKFNMDQMVLKAKDLLSKGWSSKFVEQELYKTRDSFTSFDDVEEAMKLALK